MTDLTPYRGPDRVPANGHGNGPAQPPHGPGPGAPGGPGGQPVDTIELREVVDVLRRNWKLIGLITVVTVALAAVIVLRQPPEYRAQGMIRLEDERAAMTGGLQGPLMEQALGKTEDPLLSQVQVLRSRGVVGAVVDRLGLRLQPDTHELPHTL
ncbi:MAG TPA: Wzz/FepE/Etk N-terminal domain-containing protein, partial [Longimicrobiales bacterium]|nr:Wzz/FepE/Etk N-terminal domain-containing protein [Longimicrobiales bacterium]